MHTVKVYEQGRFTVFWSALTGGRGVVDLHIDTHLLNTKADLHRAEAMVGKAADDVETMLSQNMKTRRQNDHAA